VAQLHAEHRRLQLVDAEIPADVGVVVLRLAAVDAEDLQPLGERRVVGDAHAGIAEGTEVLGREERQAADVAIAAGPATGGIFRADGLGGVLDHAQAMTAGDRHQPRHVGELAIEMHGHDRPQPAAGP
jgi:hypothetical protein